MEQETVLIVSGIPGCQIKSTEAGLASRPSAQFFGETAWDTLATALSGFSKHISKALDAAGAVESQCFDIDQVEVSAVITADGKIALLGSSLSGGMEGGVKFVWRRKARVD